MTIKRPAALLLAAVMAGALFGCGGKTPEQSAPDPSGTGNAFWETAAGTGEETGPTDPTAGTEESGEPGGNDAPSSGKTSKTNTANSTGTPVVTRPTAPSGERKTISFMTVERSNMKYSITKDSAILREIQEQTNTDIKFSVYPESNYLEVMGNRLAAGVNLPDIVFTGWQADPTPAYNGVFIELSDLIAKHAPNIVKVYQKYPMIPKLNTTKEKKLYWVSGVDQTVSNGQVLPLVHAVSVRKDWLGKAGISKTPATTDEFYQALKAFRDKDVNGNGLQDEVFCMWFNWQDAVQAWFGVPSDSFSIENGKAKYVWDYDGAYDFIAFMRRLYTEKLLDQDVFNISGEKILTKISQNKVGAISYWADCSALEDMTGEKNAEYVNLMPLKTPNGAQGQFSIQNYGNTGAHYAVTKDCKDPAAAVRFLDWFYSDYAQQLAAWGIEGIHCERVNGQLRYTQNYVDRVIQGKDVAGIDDIYDWIPCLPFVRINQWEQKNTTHHYTQQHLDKQKDVLKLSTWSQQVSCDFVGLPTPDEVKKNSDYSSDMSTYAVERLTKFINGREATFNRSVWDAFVKKLHDDYPLDERAAIYQAQYDRIK